MSTIFQAGLPLSKTIASKTKQSLKQIKTKQASGSRCAPTGLRRVSLEFIKGHQSSGCSVSKEYHCVLFQKTKQRQKQKQTKTPTNLPARPNDVGMYFLQNKSNFLYSEYLKSHFRLFQCQSNFGLLATVLYFR